MIKNLIPKNEFIRNVLTLMTGSVVAQALSIAILPVLTRIYSPADFGILAVFIALLTILSSVACFRFDIAIPMPEKDSDAKSLVVLAFISLFCIVSVLLVVILLFTSEIILLIERPELQEYLILLPLTVFMATSYNILQYWATRKKRFLSISKTRMTQAVAGSGSQALFGYLGFTAGGLIIGHVIFNAMGILSFVGRMFKDDRGFLKNISKNDLKVVFKKYDKFPKFSTFDALANSAAIQLPILIIATLTLGKEVGFLMLAMRIMQAPMSLLGTSISQVYLSEAPTKYRDNTLHDLTLSTLRGLAKVGIGPIIFAGLIAPSVFPIVFGSEWARAGEIVCWMTPWFVFQFLASPISMVMHVTNNQKVMLFLTVTGFFIRISSVYIAYLFVNDKIIEFYALSGFVFYFICFIFFSKIAVIPLRKLVSVFTGSLVIILVWCIVAICINFAILEFYV